MTNSKTNKGTISLMGMYRNLITRLKALIITPRKEWEVIGREKMSFNEILGQFNLPLIGFYTAAVFVGYLLSQNGLNFEIALKKAVFTFSSYFFGLYIAYYILLKVMELFRQEVDKGMVFKLVAYPSVVMYLVGIVSALFPETFFIGYVINLYLVYLVWLGIGQTPTSTKEAHVWQTVLFSFVILTIPMLIEKLFVYISELSL